MNLVIRINIINLIVQIYKETIKIEMYKHKKKR